MVISKDVSLIRRKVKIISTEKTEYVCGCTREMKKMFEENPERVYTVDDHYINYRNKVSFAGWTWHIDDLVFVDIDNKSIYTINFPKKSIRFNIEGLDL